MALPLPRSQSADFLSDLPEKLEAALVDWGMGDLAHWGARTLLIVGVITVAAALHFVARRILVKSLRSFVDRTEGKWDDALADNKVFDWAAHIVPALVIYFTPHLVFTGSDEEHLRFGVQRLALAYMTLIGAMIASAVLSAVVQIYETSFKAAREHPIRSYIQVVKIFLWLLAIILIITTLMNRSPWAFLGGLGAMTAVLLLVFKDAILGFVASIQIAGNDMVRVGDWVEMPKFEADGDVLEISLTTVKVQNWDKTVTTIPTYALVSHPFRNWRGMSESGGRRIKRNLLIDQNSVRFLDEASLQKYRRIEYIREYLERKLEELRTWNQDQKIDMESLVNGRRLTNLGTFRAYVEAYLRNHTQIHQAGMTFLVRQLAPSEKGVGIEIYVFSKEQRWVQYEAIQADIFDHLLAVLPEFDLRVVQQPTGADLRALNLR